MEGYNYKIFEFLKREITHKYLSEHTTREARPLQVVSLSEIKPSGFFMPKTDLPHTFPFGGEGKNPRKLEKI
jgi:hypothetical protein